MNKRTMLIGVVGAAISGAFLVAGATWAGERTPITAEEFAKLKPVGGIDLEAKQVGLLVGGGSGSGMLNFKGKNHPFTIKGGAVGTVGATKIHATGNVFRLEKLEDFNGIYTAVGAGGALVKGAGRVQFENEKGVILDLKSKSEGAALNLGVSTVTVNLVKEGDKAGAKK